MERNVSSLLVCLFLALAGCGSGKVNPEGPAIVDDEKQYEENLIKARDLSQKHLVAFLQGQELDEEAMRDLREARRHFDGLVSFVPTMYAPHIGSGRISYVLGDYPTAKQSLEQGLALLPEAKDSQVLFIMAGANDDLANVSLLSGDLDAAEKYAKVALATSPADPNFLSTGASIAIQRKDFALAKRYLAAATKSDPNNLRVKRLQKLLDASKKD